MTVPGWYRHFDDPVPLSAGGQLLTLRDAADYVTKLPKRQHSAAEWQAAIEALILIAEHSGDTMLPRSRDCNIAMPLKCGA